MKLTARERQITELVARGLANKEVATALGVTEGTVKVYVSWIYDKLKINRSGNPRVRLAIYAIEQGLAPMPVRAAD